MIENIVKQVVNVVEAEQISTSHVLKTSALATESVSMGIPGGIDAILPPSGTLDTPEWPKLPSDIDPIVAFAHTSENVRHVYDHMEGSIKDFFKKLGADVQIEPKGQPRGGKADIVGKGPNGERIIGEIKTFKEAMGSASAWWSYWKKHLATHYSDSFDALSTQSKGWCAVVDGQLRNYCAAHGTNIGQLVVEKGDVFSNDIEKSLDFLKSEGRVKNWECLGSDPQGNLYFRIEYA